MDRNARPRPSIGQAGPDLDPGIAIRGSYRICSATSTRNIVRTFSIWLRIVA
jgi:hypothetical protein